MWPQLKRENVGLKWVKAFKMWVKYQLECLKIKMSFKFLQALSSPIVPAAGTHT